MLREAKNGMVLNRAIYVFVVVTIIYTPLGFIALNTYLPRYLPSILPIHAILKNFAGVLGIAYPEYELTR